MIRCAAGLLAALAVVGCALPALTPAPTAVPRPASYRYAESWPAIDVEPITPCPGQPLVFTLGKLPPGEPFTLWLGPYKPDGSYIPPGPSLADGYHPFGSGVADAAGRASWAGVPPTGIGESVWLTYDKRGEFLVGVANLLCGTSAPIQGRVADAHGQPPPAGATLAVVVRQGYHLVLATKAVPVVDGRYAFPPLPLGGQFEFTLQVPGWPARFRREGPVEGRSRPLTFNFGGPAEAADPDGPAFFVGPEINDPAIATTTVRGRVYDPQGRPVPDAWEVGVRIGVITYPVRGGAYVATGVPTGERHYVQLWHGEFGVPDTSVARVFGADLPATLDFGGPDAATAGPPYTGPSGPPPPTPTPYPPNPFPTP